MTVNHGVLGSSPCSGARGSLAQLVQSICLTSRGSAVRIRQLPQTKKNEETSIISKSFFLFLIGRIKKIWGRPIRNKKKVLALFSGELLHFFEFVWASRRAERKGVKRSRLSLRSSQSEYRDWVSRSFLFYIRWWEISLPDKIIYINSDFYPLIEYCRNSFASSRSCPSVNWLTSAWKRGEWLWCTVWHNSWMMT